MSVTLPLALSEATLAMGLELCLILLSCCIYGSKVRVAFLESVENVPKEFVDKEFIKPRFNVKKLRSCVESMRHVKFIKDLTPDQKALLTWLLEQFTVQEMDLVDPLTVEGDILQFSVDRHLSKSQEEAFKQAAEKYGTVTAFHGSPTQNWLPILLTGLKNLSGTKLQTSGNLYGDGVYLSSELSVCSMFAKYESCKRNTLGSHLKVIGVAEIALHPEHVKHEKNPDRVEGHDIPSSYYVVKHGGYINIKGLIIWRETQDARNSHNSTSLFLIAFYVFVLCFVIALSGKSTNFARNTKRVLKFLGWR